MKKTSEEWQKILLDGVNITICDPDGWDRRNWKESFQEEKITAAEFGTRVGMSTCMAEVGAFDELQKRIGVWTNQENSQEEQKA